MTASAGEARRDPPSLVKRVEDDRTPVRTGSRSGGAVITPADDHEAWQETAHLLRSPANARRLREAVARDEAGAPTVARTVEELRNLAGGG
ncbi:type II toxin-antitoxin system Phd/YefM family antitoxin [Streptomyces sp. NPDC101213]|uniref:type II toxin-antitoxin system Phd/YefM family antitoxin n=1 Tax=Streptomyces sp. NPDC101213 TaxID=3366130 RepID=UPI0038075F4B